MSKRRNILVTGATGKQGSALIHALLQPDQSVTPDPTISYNIYALTRKPSGPSAQHLIQTYGSENLTLVEGNLDDRDSVVAAFKMAKLDSEEGNGGIWGVYAMMAFPGLGASAEGEERQGKMLADIALEYRVSVFVYSSIMRSGPKYEDKLDLKPSGKAKANIEQHCMALGDKGLRWIILRPGFFMENFDDFIGSVAFAILKKGLKEDSNIALIASSDIGNVAAGVLRNHEKYIHKVLVLASDFLTMSGIEESYQRATGKPIPAVPGAFAWILVKMNKATQDLIQDIEQNHYARASGDYPELVDELALANSAYKMKTYYEWVMQGKKGKGRSTNWNEVSLGKLVTGKM